MTNYSKYSPTDGPNPSNTSANYRWLPPETIHDIIEEGMAPTVRILRLVQGLTESTASHAQSKVAGPIGEHELVLRKLIAINVNADDLEEIYTDFEIATSEIEMTARYEGWALGIAHAIQNCNMGLPQGEFEDIAVDEWPFPHSSLVDLVRQFNELAPGPANKHLSQIYKYTIPETQAVYVACYRLGYAHGYAIWHGQTSFTGMVNRDPAH